MDELQSEILIIGAGISGIATAWSLAREQGVTDVILVDTRAPLSFTSAHSGENYRNWWPHPAMVAFTERSTEIMEQVARDHDNVLHMTRNGYALATRSRDIEALQAQLQAGYESKPADYIRLHDAPHSPAYQRHPNGDWRTAPDGVDILQNDDLIRAAFPSFSDEVKTVIHLRRCGDISSQQLGQHMLSEFRELGGNRLQGHVRAIDPAGNFRTDVQTAEGKLAIVSRVIVNAAGPFAPHIAGLAGESLPIRNVLQQKIAFEDVRAAIPRSMPFAIDLDAQVLDWSDDERAALGESEEFRWLTEEMAGGIHCRPDGGPHGTWIRLGWAFNRQTTEPAWEPELDDQFPEIVLRAAARLNPSLKAYYGQLPRAMTHYGGYYSMTEENWPLVGPTTIPGLFVVGAMSGFGTMAACAAGELCAKWITGAELPSYAHALSLDRYGDSSLMQSLKDADRGIL